jgi:hypothetical protein
MLHRAKALSRRCSFLLSALLILPSMVWPPNVGATAEDGAAAIPHPRASTAVLVPGIDSFSPQANKESETNSLIDLEALLAKTAEYCAKLESSVLNFVCREEIRETIDPSLEIDDSRYSDLVLWPRVSPPRAVKIENTYIYDYQCIRSGRAIQEVRILLRENGRMKHERNAVLKTSVVVFETALMWPVGVYSERFQPDYDFTAVRRDKVGRRPVVVIDARPKPGAPEARNLYGQAWIDLATAEILRVEWNESRVGGYDVFAKRGARFQRTPRLTIRSEFSAEKNGLRFPSHMVAEEAYLGKSGGKFVRSKTEVTYKNFKFFTVEVEVDVGR